MTRRASSSRRTAQAVGHWLSMATAAPAASIAAPMRLLLRRSTTYPPARQFSASATIRQIAALDMRHRGPSCQAPSTLPAGSLNVATQRSPSGYGGLTIAPPLAATRSKAASMPWT